jgi:hypothetical protein
MPIDADLSRKQVGINQEKAAQLSGLKVFKRSRNNEEATALCYKDRRDCRKAI